MIKLVLAVMLGTGLYMSLSYYQPIIESAEATKQAEASQSSPFSFISPIPFDLIVSQK